MDIPWGDIATFVTAGASTVAAFLAWRTAVRSAATADTVARIEQERWHSDLTPRFELELAETGNGQASLLLRLAGPDSLQHLDRISIEVGNDDKERVLFHSGPDVSQADIDAFVWGPLKFTPGVNGTDENGRGPEPFSLEVGRGTQRAMQRTHPGHWMTGKTQGMWQGEYVGQPVRLVLRCRRGEQEWVIARQLDNPLFSSGS
ncbi:hypothetical protein ACN6LF_001889 [[Kitasatospora] papulosa]|uniref:hypothetical protein n=1 Tax=[Kitasatospora] papulosa TaxID=1464011 RepID=UPI00386A7373|nr:hypothetical protein OG337_29185 [[Kitasatospora] papulosa]